MFTKISSLTLAILLFLVVLGSQSHLYVFGISLAVLMLATFAINYKRLNFTWPHLLLPVIYLLGLGSIFIIIPLSALRIIFLILASVVFYFLEIKLGRESHFLQNIYLLSVFALYLGLFAFQYYFKLAFFWFIPICFALTYFFTIQGFAGFSLPAKKYFYILIATVCSEAATGLIIWPTHYFVDAVVLFCIFYALWIFSFSAFFGKLTRQKVYWQLILVSMVLLITLSTAAWRPIR
jgi:hypothetical protein